MVDFTKLDFSSLPIDTFIMLVFYLILGAYAIFSAVLYYHWVTYGNNLKITGLTLILYFSCTVPLVIAMSTMALTI